MPNQILSVRDLVLNLSTLEVTRAHLPIYLRKKELQLLAYFLKHQGKLLTRQMILDQVWADNLEVFPNVVDVHIKYLRDKIDKPFSKPLIKTLHGWGYKLEG